MEKIRTMHIDHHPQTKRHRAAIVVLLTFILFCFFHLLPTQPTQCECSGRLQQAGQVSVEPQVSVKKPHWLEVSVNQPRWLVLAGQCETATLAWGQCETATLACSQCETAMLAWGQCETVTLTWGQCETATLACSQCETATLACTGRWAINSHAGLYRQVSDQQPPWLVQAGERSTATLACTGRWAINSHPGLYRQVSDQQPRWLVQAGERSTATLACTGRWAINSHAGLYRQVSDQQPPWVVQAGERSTATLACTGRWAINSHAGLYRQVSDQQPPWLVVYWSEWWATDPQRRVVRPGPGVTHTTVTQSAVAGGVFFLVFLSRAKLKKAGDIVRGQLELGQQLSWFPAVRDGDDGRTGRKEMKCMDNRELNCWSGRELTVTFNSRNPEKYKLCCVWDDVLTGAYGTEQWKWIVSEVFLVTWIENLNTKIWGWGIWRMGMEQQKLGRGWGRGALWLESELLLV